jgi:hypothetical protein
VLYETPCVGFSRQGQRGKDYYKPPTPYIQYHHSAVLPKSKTQRMKCWRLNAIRTSFKEFDFIHQIPSCELPYIFSYNLDMSDVVIGKGKLAGKGIYANRKFFKGDIVIKYTLKLLTKEEWKLLPKSEKNVYSQALGKGLSVFRTRTFC